MSSSHILLLVLANTVWGFNIVAAKFGVGHFPPIFFSALRFTIVFAVALPFLRPTPGQVKLVIAAALFTGVLHYSLMFTAMSIAAEVSPLAVAVQLFVPFSTIIAVIFLGERVGYWRVGGLSLAFGGIVVIGFEPSIFADIDALALTALAALAMAISTVFIKSMRGIGVFNLQAWIALLGAPGLYLVSYFFESGQIEAFKTAGLMEWGSVAFSAIGASLVGHGIIFYLLRLHPVSVVTPFTLLTPVLGIAFAVVLLGDHLTVRLVAGAILTMSGVVVISLRESRRRALAKENQSPPAVGTGN